MPIKTEAEYDEFEKKYGLTARRALEASDKQTAEFEKDGDLGKALENAFGAAYRPGQTTGK